VSLESCERVSCDGLLGTCERVLAEHAALKRCVSIEPRRREEQDADLRLLFSDRSWLRSQAGTDLIAAFAEHPTLARVQRHRSAILLRFEDTALAALEQRLATGELVGMASTHILVGRRFVVSIVGPNTNKALHVGHLRNIVVGQALAAAMGAAGACVEHHNLVGDIGRRVCEAMGGYTACHEGEDPQMLGLAGDRFVELCCRDFPHEAVQATEQERVRDPNAEEREPCGDLADAIMQAWMRNERRERALWRRMREWALDGHKQTLARLGLVMQRQDYESDGVERALELIARGLEDGLFEREPSGGVVYRTGRSEYTNMVLLRADGVPTEYARLLGVYHRLHEHLTPDGVYVEVVGIEWRPAMEVLAELLTILLATPSEERYTWAFHGSLTVGGQKMGSSTGEVLWIDDLMQEVAAGPAAEALHALAGGAAGRDELADMLVRATFLCSPTLEPLVFERERLAEGNIGPGWTIARAWCRALREQRERIAAGTIGTPGPESRASRPAARVALVQSQLYARSLGRAVRRRDAAGLAIYLLDLSQAYLAASAPSPAAAPVLACVLGNLGFPTASHAARHANQVPAVSASHARHDQAAVGSDSERHRL
jgi:arginyl-tRNA synthetase